MVDKSAFRHVLGSYATGITVATAALSDGRRAGLTVNSFTSVSLDPPLVLFCLDKRAVANQVFSETTGFAINILTQEQQAVSSAFAKPGQGGERWQGQGVETWETGAPILSESLASLDCTLTARHDAGDHSILVGQVVRLQHRGGQPLLYWSSCYHHLAVKA